VKICDGCGEISIPDERDLCDYCLIDVRINDLYDYEPFRDLYNEYAERTCNCEDWPCCGH
jgi:hypothetical protein